jgi:hypothetical protein
MKRAALLTVLAVIGGIAALSYQTEPSGVAMAQPATKTGPLLVHNVYFSLKDHSPAAQKKLVDACMKYLTGHPGTVFFAAGTASDLDRPVNDRDFDVGLHVIFKDRAAHDVYQTAERHLKFIEENRDSWEKVRVFDSDCETGT